MAEVKGLASVDHRSLPGREGRKTGLGKGARGPEWLALKMGGSKVTESERRKALRLARFCGETGTPGVVEP